MYGWFKACSMKVNSAIEFPPGHIDRQVLAIVKRKNYRRIPGGAAIPCSIDHHLGLFSVITRIGNGREIYEQGGKIDRAVRPVNARRITDVVAPIHFQ